MRRFVLRLLPVCCLVSFGCAGELEGLTADESPLYCYGDPDTAITCVDQNDVWTCETMPNGEKKCVHTPDGQEGWTCVEDADGHAVCTSEVPGASGGAGWDCVTEDGTTVCTSVIPVSGTNGDGPSGLTPFGAGSWTCTVTEFGVLCTGNFDDSPPESTSDSEEEESENTSDVPQAELPESGDFRTQTPGGWGAPAAGGNAGAYRDANFADAFPQGLVIGCSAGHTALFTSAKAIELFLPAGETPGVLDQDLVDPMTTSAGVLAGHAVAATLAVGFDLYDPNFGASSVNLKHLVALKGPCLGMTVQQILALANNVLGGCSTQMDPSSITTCLDIINNEYVDGVKVNGALGYP